MEQEAAHKKRENENKVKIEVKKVREAKKVAGKATSSTDTLDSQHRCDQEANSKKH